MVWTTLFLVIIRHSLSNNSSSFAFIIFSFFFFFSMFTDVADFHEWKFNQRATGLIIAGIMFAIKMGVAIGGSLGLYILGQFGYDANIPITPEVIHGIKLLFSLIPAGFMMVCGVILFFYPISEKMLVQIEADLKERKSNQ